MAPEIQYTACDIKAIHVQPGQLKNLEENIPPGIDDYYASRHIYLILTEDLCSVRSWLAGSRGGAVTNPSRPEVDQHEGKDYVLAAGRCKPCPWQ
jgi:hypothetical protein